MSTKDLSLSERLRVWESTGLEVVLRPAQIKELRHNLDETVSFCTDNLIEAERKRQAARRLLMGCWYLVAFNLASLLLTVVLQ